MSLIPLNDAFAKVEEGIRTLPAEMVSVADALGRVVAEDVAARLTQPLPRFLQWMAMRWFHLISLYIL